jgi:hypothetical protein
MTFGTLEGYNPADTVAPTTGMSAPRKTNVDLADALAYLGGKVVELGDEPAADQS